MRALGILFDCDGVLVDSEIVGLEDVAAFLSEVGFAWTPEELIRRFTGMRTDALVGGLREEYARILGRTPSDDEMATLIDGYIETRRAQRHTMKIVPGAIEAVEAAAAMFGPRMAVASSSGQIYLDDKVARYGFAPHFGPHVYSADHVSHGKPAPDIFLFAAERIGVAPADCLVIEDSAHGVAAGVAAGAEVWGFTGGGHCLHDHAAQLTAKGATRVLADHAQLRAAFAQLSR